MSSMFGSRDKTPAAGLGPAVPENGIENHSPEGANNYGDNYCAAARDVWVPGEHPQAISELHWRRVDEARFRQLFRERHAGHRPDAVRDSALECGRHRQGAGCGARSEDGVGQDLSPRHGRASWNRSRSAWKTTWRCWRTVETWDNGKPIRETMAADLPLAIDHFRYFAGCIRAQEGGISELDETTVAYHYHEPLGVVGMIIPRNFPLLMATWKLAPALAAGNCRGARSRRSRRRLASWC